MSSTEIIEARVVARPYVMYGALGGWAPLLLLYGAITTVEERSSLLFGFTLGAFIFSWLFLSFWFYRVGVQDGYLVERKFLTPKKLIPISSITSWEYEVGLSNQVGWIRIKDLRPFRRITLYYTGKDSRDSFVDISLVHFSNPDVRKILQIIKGIRPELGSIKGFRF